MEFDGFNDQVSMYEPTAYDSDAGFSGSEQFRDFARNGMVRLEENEGEHNVIKNGFLVGMGVLGKEIDVVAVHKNSCSSVSGQARMESFRIFSQAVAAKRGGDANIKNGWYGGYREEISNIVSYGFGRCADFEKGVSHGVGVYLSPSNVPNDSALRAKEDENGVRHMLLCRVILGNTETICAGSEQSYPSSTHFDSGIDNPWSPRKYIIWSAYMNSHISPYYIISFKAPSLVGMKLPVLLNALSRCLHPSKMGLVLNYCNDLRGNKIDRRELIRRLRNLVGDKMLISVIKLCRNESV